MVHQEIRYHVSSVVILVSFKSSQLDTFGILSALLAFRYLSIIMFGSERPWLECIGPLVVTGVGAFLWGLAVGPIDEVSRCCRAGGTSLASIGMDWEAHL